MDPDAVLQDALDRAQHIIECVDDLDDPGMLARDVKALHDWIANGGRLPTAWKKQE